MKRMLLTSAVTLTLATAGLASAQPQSFTFAPDVGTSGDWDDPDNWDGPGGIPGAGDIVGIPDNLQCIVEDADQEAMIIQVGDGAELVIRSRNLTIAAGLLSAVLKVDGEVIFEQTDEATPAIYYTSPFTIDVIEGTGVLNASDADGNGPGIIWPESSSGVIDIRAGITVKGSLDIRAPNGVNLDGALLVNDADDTMFLGQQTSGTAPLLTGDGGTITVSAGDLQVGLLKFSGLLSSLDIDITISGGRLLMTQYATHVFNYVTVTMTGGTWELETSWDSRGGMSLKGGSMRLLFGETASLQ